jgi:hypothetical protein
MLLNPDLEFLSFLLLHQIIFFEKCRYLLDALNRSINSKPLKSRHVQQYTYSKA